MHLYELIIDLIKVRPALWSKKHVDYKDSIKKQVIYNEITEYINKNYGQNISGMLQFA